MDDTTGVLAGTKAVAVADRKMGAGGNFDDSVGDRGDCDDDAEKFEKDRDWGNTVGDTGQITGGHEDTRGVWDRRLLLPNSHVIENFGLLFVNCGTGTVTGISIGVASGIGLDTGVEQDNGTGTAASSGRNRCLPFFH